jgi:excisionase family DNA binding protein
MIVDTPTQPLLVDAREAARLLAVSPRTLYSLTRAGRLHAIPVGPRGIRYSRADLESFIASAKI